MWQGGRLKEELSKQGLSMSKFASELGVSKTAVSDWIKGSMPRGQHLIGICQILQVAPDYLFNRDLPDISIPVHRKKLANKITDDSRDASLEVAYLYLNLFRNAKPPKLEYVLQNISDDAEEQLSVASQMRRLAGVENPNPINYAQVFELLDKLNIVTIFRSFPDSIRAYAFHTEINGHRVIFVDIKTNIIDLIFVLLHEAIHAVIYKAKKSQSTYYGDTEETFCDKVAGLIQFPPSYVQSLIDNLKGKQKVEKVLILKQFAKQNSHATYGISQLIKAKSNILDDIDRTVFAGADARIRKNTLTIENILFSSDDPAEYIRILRKLSPFFIQLLQGEIDKVSMSKISEWVDLGSIADAKQAVAELRR
jgi:transcriptional regulator with XRE-family HTH domain